MFLTFGGGLRYNIVGIDFSYIYALEEDHPLANTMRSRVVSDWLLRAKETDEQAAGVYRFRNP